MGFGIGNHQQTYGLCGRRRDASRPDSRLPPPHAGKANQIGERSPACGLRIRPAYRVQNFPCHRLLSNLRRGSTCRARTGMSEKKTRQGGPREGTERRFVIARYLRLFPVMGFVVALLLTIGYAAVHYADELRQCLRNRCRRRAPTWGQLRLIRLSWAAILLTGEIEVQFLLL